MASTIAPTSPPASTPPREPPRRRDTARPWYGPAVRLLPAQVRGPWLDFGCGQGEFLELAARRGLAGIGVDLERANARALRGAGRPVCVADLARPLPLATASLAGATLIEVIEHVANAEALAGELARVIRSGGWLIATTPNVAHWTYRWRALRGHPPKQEGRHLRFFTRSGFEALFARAGFALRERASFGKLALASGWRRLRGDRRKLHYPIGAAFEPLLALHFVWRFERA
jgi:SAM-dependent methyltransferase